MRAVRTAANDGTCGWARQVAAEAIMANELLPPATRPGRLDRLHYRDEVVDRVYAALWAAFVGHAEYAA